MYLIVSWNFLCLLCWCWCEFTAHNWQKCKSTFLTCHCHEIYREAVGLKKVPIIYLKNNYIFCEYVKFGAISLKIDIFLITAQLKFESKSSFAQMWHILLLSDANHILFLLNRFSVKYRFPFQFCVLTLKSPSVTQRSVSLKKDFKKSKNPSPFFVKL